MQRRNPKIPLEYRPPKLAMLSIGALLLLAGYAFALEPEFRYIRYDNGIIAANIVLADSLPRELIDYLNKGVPISFEYKLELWKANPGWFDKSISKAMVVYKVRYDSWDKRYTITQESKDAIIEHVLGREREAIDLLTSSGRNLFELPDSSGLFYLTGELVIRTMTFSSYKEVESWLKGGLSHAKAPKLENAPDQVGEFMFNMALKISGLKNLSAQVRSRQFSIKDLPILLSN